MLERNALPLEIQYLPRYICPCQHGNPHDPPDLLVPRSTHPLLGILRLDCPHCGRSWRLRGVQRTHDRGVDFELTEVGIGDP